MTIAQNQNNTKKVNFSQLMPRILGLLTTKEQDILGRRFSLNGIPKETLDKIGKSYSITRERVRQIENVALKKLARISMDPAMRTIFDLAYTILLKNGKIMSEDLLLSEMLKELNDPNIDANAMKLAMRVSPKLVKQEKNQIFKPFWRALEVPVDKIKIAIKDIVKLLKKEKNVMSIDDIAKKLSDKYSKIMIQSLMFIHWEFLVTKDKKWGLKSWRFINPRSIKDKILIILKKEGHPLHFSKIIEYVLNKFESKKIVTTQAIHNELIRQEEFVLVGRGLYGIKEWGLIAGTVCDVIKSVFEENSFEPMKRQDIINKVLEKREIRIGTISLNLQKYPFFKRVGRAVYEYDSKLEKPRKKRGRKPKKISE